MGKARDGVQESVLQYTRGLNRFGGGMKHILAGLGFTLLATPAFAIDAWPQCNSPERNAKTLWACNQVIAHGWMANTIAAATY